MPKKCWLQLTGLLWYWKKLWWFSGSAVDLWRFIGDGRRRWWFLTLGLSQYLCLTSVSPAPPMGRFFILLSIHVYYRPDAVISPWLNSVQLLSSITEEHRAYLIPPVMFILSEWGLSYCLPRLFWHKNKLVTKATVAHQVLYDDFKAVSITHHLFAENETLGSN